jgi:hypothetical protein
MQDVKSLLPYHAVDSTLRAGAGREGFGRHAIGELHTETSTMSLQPWRVTPFLSPIYLYLQFSSNINRGRFPYDGPGSLQGRAHRGDTALLMQIISFAGHNGSMTRVPFHISKQL